MLRPELLQPNSVILHRGNCGPEEDTTAALCAGFPFVCSVAQSRPILCDPMECSTPGFPVLHCLLASAQIHIHRVGNAI